MMIDLPFGPCDVHRSGSGVPLLMVHGALVDHTLWDRIVPGLELAADMIRPDLPIGAHRTPVTRRDLLHPEAIADSLARLLDALDVDQTAVIGSDTGGALAQIFTARHPDRVKGLILTSCDAFDHFPTTLIKLLLPMLAIPGGIDVIANLYRSKRVRRSFMGGGLLLNHPVDDTIVKPWLRRLVDSHENRKDVRAFLRACRPKLAHAAAHELETFPRPALIAWSRGDRLFPDADAERLARTIPDCELHWIENTRTFSMIDQPDALVALIRPFLERLSSL